MRALRVGSLLVAALLLQSAVAAEPAKAPPPARLVVAIMPPAGETAAAEELGLMIQSRAAALLAENGEYQEVCVKQILRMAEREGLTAASLATRDAAALAAKRVGASRAAYGRLKADGPAWTLELSLTDASGAALEQKLPAENAKAVEVGAAALAKLVAGADKVKLRENVPALTASDEASKSYGACLAVLLKQPIGIENPSIIGEKELAAAAAACRKATSADPKFAPAWSGLALALALQGEDAKAVEALAKVDPKSGYLPLYWLARYWLVTRYQSNEAGAAVLREAIARHPGYLLARGYLGEHLNAVASYEEALVVFKEYAALCPKSPYALTREGYALSHLKRYDEAIAIARRALELEPTSRDLAVELGSRYIDAGQLDKAIETLKPVTAGAGATGEGLLRLGYAYLLKKDLASAEALFRKAEQTATRPAEWRTRGRAKFDFAKVLVLRGDAKTASEVVMEAMREGFKPYSLWRADEDLVAIAKKVEADLDKEKVAKVNLDIRPALPRETSPFAVDAAGEIDPARQRPTPPPGFALIKF